MTTTTTPVGTLIAKFRAEAGWTQETLAKKIKYGGPQAISNWERGITPPPATAYKTLCKTLGIPATTFKQALITQYEREVATAFN